MIEDKNDKKRRVISTVGKKKNKRVRFVLLPCEPCGS